MNNEGNGTRGYDIKKRDDKERFTGYPLLVSLRILYKTQENIV